MPRKKTESLSDLIDTFTSGINRVTTRPDANGYRPHAKQEQFHSSQSKGRLYIGGNRSGKTVGGVIEDIWWLLGKHPFRQTPPPPIRGRLVCVDFPNGFEKVIKPTITQWIPPSALIDGSWEASYNSRTRTLTLDNGSFIEFMSYDQDTDTFAGASRHFVHFDEEPPKAIFTENKARLIDTGGHWWITMTPVEGMTWVYDDIYEPSTSGLEPNIDVIEVDMTENSYLSPVEIEDFLSGLDEDDRKARKSGKFVQIGGVIFKGFNAENHVVPAWPMPIKLGNNKIFGSADHGLNNPTAVLWHLVTPNDDVITFREHYRSEWTIKQHVPRIREIEKEIGVSPTHYWCDPAMRQRNAINGNSIQLEYRMAGVPMVPSNNDVKIGLNRMLNYQASGKWFITEDCPNLLREMRRYRWKTRQSKKLQEVHGNYDEPHKKDDHAIDASRYFFVSMPELYIPNTPPDYAEKRRRIQTIMGARDTANIFGRYDPYARRPLMTNDRTEMKIATDEYMGGEW